MRREPGFPSVVVCMHECFLACSAARATSYSRSTIRFHHKISATRHVVSWHGMFQCNFLGAERFYFISSSGFAVGHARRRVSAISLFYARQSMSDAPVLSIIHEPTDSSSIFIHRANLRFLFFRSFQKRQHNTYFSMSVRDEPTVHTFCCLCVDDG